MIADAPAPTAAMPLWVTLRGSPAHRLVQWLAWTVAAVAGATSVGGRFGPTWVAVGILTAGWFLARRCSTPLDWVRRYHLDDDEVIALGPWRRVQRITWGQVEHVTQERHALVLAGAGKSIAIPLRSLRATAAWGPVLARVVPNLASTLWERLEAGAVRLVPHVDPPTASLLWWAYLPTLLACAVVPSGTTAAIVAAVAAAERLGAWLLGQARACTLQPAGIEVRGRHGRIFVPWAHALVTPAEDGLGISVPGHDPGFVPTGATSFWAAAAVIELRAQLGPNYAADVNFRVRFENGGIAVVGEVESFH